MKMYERDGTCKFPKDFPPISKSMKRLLEKMCQIDEKKRPTPTQLLQDIDYIQLTRRTEIFLKQLDQEKDQIYKLQKMFQFNSYNVEGHVELFNIMDELTYNIPEVNDGFIKPQRLYHTPIQSDDYLMNKSQSDEFDKITHKINHQMQSINKAHNVNLKFTRSSQMYTKLSLFQKSLIRFTLAKYQCMKVQKLKYNVFSLKNWMKIEQQLWSKYLKSHSYWKLVDYISQQSKISVEIFNQIYNQQKTNFKQIYESSDKILLEQLEKVFHPKLDFQFEQSMLETFVFLKKQLESKSQSKESNNQKNQLQLFTIKYPFEIYIDKQIEKFNQQKH